MATRAKALRARNGERIFFSGMALAMVAVIVIGFAPSYYLRGAIPAAGPLLPMSPLVHLHGALFTGWMLLFATQTGLVAAGRTDIHRRLGMIAFAVLPAMIVVATLTALHGVARHSGPPGIPPLSWLAIPLIGVPGFAGLIFWGLAKRRDPAAHKRLMFIAMTSMLGPGFGRMAWPAFIPPPLFIFGFNNLFVLALAAWDVKSRGKVHPMTIGGGLFALVFEALPIFVWFSGPWLSFARWAVGLVG
jgi:hypothetical protein